MEKAKTSFAKNKLFSFFTVFWIILGFWGIILAIAGLFYGAALGAFAILEIAALAYIFSKNKLELKITWDAALVFACSLFFIAICSIYTNTPTIFSGRDQGSFSEAAIRLSQNHKLEFATPASEEFFRIYGKGQALNFPGFSYLANGNLITQFPVGYVVWLAIFYSLFEIAGLIIANGIAFFIFLLSFYFLARLYLNKFPALIAYFLVLSSFVFSWFFKFTLSENLALAFLWFGIYEFSLFYEKNEKFHLFCSLFSIFILTFTRIEAWAFLAVMVLILARKYGQEKTLKLFLNKKIIAALGIFLAIFAANLAINYPYYLTIAKGFINSLNLYKGGLSQPSEPFLGLAYLTKIFFAYSLFSLVAFGILGFLHFIKTKNYKLLIPFAIVLPSFIYLINPSISQDHPWMLRRFVFSIVPVSILLAIMFLDVFFKKKYYFYAACFLLLATNILVAVPYLKISENNNLLPEVSQLSQNFESSDLVLVDRLATGSAWSMMSGPMSFLGQKQAVYFFNPKDLEKIDSTKFKNIYLIIPDDNLDFYKDISYRLSPVKDYTITTDYLNVKIGKKDELFRSPVELPSTQEKIVYGKIYLLKK